MKIVQVVCVYPPYKGGMGNVARDFAGLVALKHQSSVITFGKNNDCGVANERGVKIKKLRPFLWFGNGAFLPQLFFGLKEFDIVHLHYPFFGVAEIIFCVKFFLRQRFKLAIHYHMDTPRLAGIARVLSFFSRLIEKSLFKIADQITYASEGYIKQSAISKYYQKRPDKFFLLPFGVDTNKFCPVKNNALGKKYILFVGALDKAHYFKGVENLIRALEGVINDDLNLTIVGRGDMQDEYKKIADDLGLGKFVNFAGGVSDDDLAVFYQNASLFVLPSINGHEAFGMVLLEAMACGVPVVASDLPGVRTVFSDGQEGLLVNPGDVDDLREKIVLLISNEELIKKMGERARELVLREYGFDVLEKRLGKLYVL